MFESTRWSLVQSLKADDADAKKALEALCTTYWRPLYLHVRRRGYDSEEAKDIIQAFFMKVLEDDTLRKADRSRGRFRSYLLTALHRFISNEKRRESADKRGGKVTFVSFDWDAAESEVQLTNSDQLTPEQLFTKRWAIEVMHQALLRLEAVYRERNHLEMFFALRPFLTADEPEPNREELARRLEMTPNALKVALHRFRRQYLTQIRAEVRESVSNPDDLEIELKDLLESL